MGIITHAEHSRNHREEQLKTLPYISILVREKRVELGLSQFELAKKLNIGLKTLRKIEQGDLSVTYLKLNYLLNCLGLYLLPQEIVSSTSKMKNKILSRKKVLQMLQNILPIFRIKFGVSELALFGSYAMETQTEKSDIDILISFKEKVDFEVEGEIQLILENLFNGVKVDLTIKRNLHKNLKKHILESKIDIKEQI